MQFEIENWRGLQRLSVELPEAGLLRIGGNNAVGKSSLISALQAVFGRNKNPLGLGAIDQRHWLGHNGQPFKLELQRGADLTTLTPSGLVVDDDLPHCSDFALGLTNPLRLPEKQRVAALEEILLPKDAVHAGLRGVLVHAFTGKRPTESELEALLNANPELEARIDEVMELVDDGSPVAFAAACKIYEGRRAKAARRWETIVGDGVRFGAAKAVNWRPDLWRDQLEEMPKGQAAEIVQQRVEFAKRDAAKLEGAKHMRSSTAMLRTRMNGAAAELESVKNRPLGEFTQEDVAELSSTVRDLESYAESPTHPPQFEPLHTTASEQLEQLRAQDADFKSEQDAIKSLNKTYDDAQFRIAEIQTETQLLAAQVENIENASKDAIACPNCATALNFEDGKLTIAPVVGLAEATNRIEALTAERERLERIDAAEAGQCEPVGERQMQAAAKAAKAEAELNNEAAKNYQSEQSAYRKYLSEVAELQAKRDRLLEKQRKSENANGERLREVTAAEAQLKNATKSFNQAAQKTPTDEEIKDLKGYADLAISKLEDAKRDLRLVEQMLHANEALADWHACNDVAKSLGTKGWRHQKIAEALKPVSAVLDGFCTGANMERIAISADLSIRYDRKPLECWSASESWRCDIAIRLALAVAANERIVLVDGADILDTASSAAFFAAVKGWAQRAGVLLVVAATGPRGDLILE